MLLYVKQELTVNVEVSEVVQEFKSIVPFHRQLLLRVNKINDMINILY